MKKYLLIIRPPEDIFLSVKDLKLDLRKTYGSFDSVNSIAHITLFHGYISGYSGNDILSKLEEALHGINSFKIQLNGFGKFEESRTIYLNTEPKKEILNIHKKIFAYFPEITPLQHPHLTIAKDLDQAIFEESWNQIYKSKEFCAEFSCHSLVLYQRSRFEYKEVAEISFS
jgi:2'-5' RNA ligase